MEKTVYLFDSSEKIASVLLHIIYPIYSLIKQIFGTDNKTKTNKKRRKIMKSDNIFESNIKNVLILIHNITLY